MPARKACACVVQAKVHEWRQSEVVSYSRGVEIHKVKEKNAKKNEKREKKGKKGKKKKGQRSKKIKENKENENQRAGKRVFAMAYNPTRRPRQTMIALLSSP
jgi:hypothetical protein